MVKNILSKKLFRDMIDVKWQFLSIIILSALGVLVFGGLDASWRDLNMSINQYFEKQQLADYWVMAPFTDRNTKAKIEGLEGIEVMQSRISVEVAADLPGEPTLMLHGLDGEARINVPLIQSGTSLASDDLKGCLLEQQFAETQNLSVGDTLTVQAGEQEQPFIIRGLVISPEYVITAKDLLPEPRSYGFILVNGGAIPQIPMNEITVLLSDTADHGFVKEAIETALPHTLVRDRSAHRSTKLIKSEITQFQSLSIVFPILFFAVSALIVLTTMARMVDNQRTQMGILKALGYRGGKLLRHYLSYGLYPSLLGSAAGLLIGRFTLPSYMWELESAFYALPPRVIAPLSFIALMVCGVSILLSCLICYLVCRKNFKEAAADLLRPKAPKAGNRILLERFLRLWERLKFNSKMILRNLFRSKTRTIMVLLGVLCCTALIITALGMQDSFRNLVSTYYEQTLQYDLRVELNEDAETLEEYQRQIPAQTVEGLMEKAVSVQGKTGSRIALLSILPQNQKLIDLGFKTQSRALPAEGIIITKKLAEVMELEIGDTITLRMPGDTNPIQITIAHLASVGLGQGLYLSADLWESFGKDIFKPTALLIQEPFEAGVKYLSRLDEVEDMEWTFSQKEKTITGMQSIISVTVLMAVFAFILAFVVLYNMGILNFMERAREFATLKVLGYHQQEIRSLIVWENALISCFGIVLGIFPGIWLTALVMRASEPDDMVLSPFVSVLSICIACALTLVFSLIIQRVLTRKVKSIDMVEALKSVE